MQKPRVCIIGIHGVGMAHLIAALDLGYDVPVVVDVQGRPFWESPRRGEYRYENTWDTIKDIHTSHAKHPPFYRECEGGLRAYDLMRHDNLDLVIVAVPTDIHFDVLDKLSKVVTCPILVEKPLLPLVDATEYDFFDLFQRLTGKGDRERYYQTFGGYEWLHHQGLTDAARGKKHNNLSDIEIVFTHSSPNKEREPIQDLGVHAMSLALYSAWVRRTKQDDLDMAEFLQHLDVSLQSVESFEDTRRGRFAFCEPNGRVTSVTLLVGYTKNEPECVKVNGEQLYWQRDLFAIQMSRILFAPEMPQHALGRAFKIEQFTSHWLAADRLRAKSKPAIL